VVSFRIEGMVFRQDVFERNVSSLQNSSKLSKSALEAKQKQVLRERLVSTVDSPSLVYYPAKAEYHAQ
jgi:hypothetical protein